MACSALVAALTFAALPVTALGQVTITASDLFNKPGQYYEAYVEKDAGVSGLLGVAGPTAQAWDFTTGPTNTVYRYDYVEVATASNAAAFADATFAERLTDASSGMVKWLYLKQAPGQGRMTYGFTDPEFSATQPTSVFSSPILDFPERIGFGDTWKSATEFMTEISFGIPDDSEGGGGDFAIPARLTYTADSKVDAFGIVNEPMLGFGECLRVNELVQYDIAVDFGFGDGFMSVASQYVRNLYWLRKGHGIAVQVTSKQLDTPPPDDFATAAVVARMFATNHEDAVVEVPTITGLKVTLGKDGVLIQWTKAAGLGRYRIDFLTGDTLTWKTLVESTTSNFFVDSAANKPTSPIRLYRIVGLN